MKFRDRKICNLMRKGLTLTLAVSMLGGVFPAFPALPSQAAETVDCKVEITDSLTRDFYVHMTDAGYGSDEVPVSKERVQELSEFLHKQNSAIKEIPSDKRDDYETDQLVWNPTQQQVDAGRDLYFLEWTNGDGYTNPGSGYEILGRIVYLTNSGEVRYSKRLNVDDYPRKLLGFGDRAQWDNKRINQCYFAVPEDCVQIVGILMSNEAGGGDNNDTWWMDSFYIYRITSDRVSDISGKSVNSQGFDQVSISNGQLVAFASPYDISQRYLATDDEREEWLYLLCSNESAEMAENHGRSYFAHIVTENSDLSGKGLTLTVHYTDITGTSRSTERVIDDSTVLDFYPQLDYPTKFEEDWYWTALSFNNKSPFNRTRTVAPRYDPGYGFKLDDGPVVNNIAFEIEKKDGAHKTRDVISHLQKSGSLLNYNWEDSNTTLTNYNAALFMGNYAHYDEMQKDVLGPYTATDIALNIPHVVKEITKLELSVANVTQGAVTLQDVQIYTADPASYTRTRMNGGISTERVFSDVKDAKCLVAVDKTTPLYVRGKTEIVPTPDPAMSNQYQLLQVNRNMSLMAEDDNLGVQISLADLYDAGLDVFMARYKDEFDPLPPKPSDVTNNFYTVSIVSMAEMRNAAMKFIESPTDLMEKDPALELFNLLDNYYKECLTLNIEYWDDFGNLRKVEVPFVTSYLLQLYSDNGGKLSSGTGEYDGIFDGFDHITGIFQQGQDMALRVPLSQYSDIKEITVSFGKSPEGVMNIRNILWWYEELPGDNYVLDPEGTGGVTHESFLINEVYANKAYTIEYIKSKFWPNETFRGGVTIPPDETFAVRAIRLYNNVTKEEFHTVYDISKRVPIFSTTRTESDYYYAAKDKNGHTFSFDSELHLSLEDKSLLIGSPNYTEQDLQNTYLVEITGQNLYGVQDITNYYSADDLYVTLAYTTTGGEEIKIQSQRLSSLAKDYNGKNQMAGITSYETDYEYQMDVDLAKGKARFTLELENVARFDYIHLSIPDGEVQSFQANSITIYKLQSLSQRYSTSQLFTNLYSFDRDFTGERVAFNNKPAALQPNREGVTFYFTKVNTDGTMEEPSTDTTYNDEYLSTPPTSMTYEETLKNLGLAIKKYTYTVDVKVANVPDAGSSNYFYFQLVFENGTSGVVLANQQLTADSFRQGQTETFTIHTTQNYGNVTAVRIICDTTSSSSQAFDKLNVESISVILPNKGSAKSWIVDKVGWIDINYQDEGVATTISEDGKTGGFPNSQVIKEFPRTRTASTARLLFNIATAAESSPIISMPSTGTFEGSLVYVDTAGHTQTYNFDLRQAVYEFIEAQNPTFIFRQNTSDYFTLSINDIASVKALNIYRSGGNLQWAIKDVSVSQFSDIGHVYKSTTGEFRRYIEDETLLTTSINGNFTLEESGNASFTFAENSIVMNTSTNDPSTWITSITRIPVTTQESMNIYLYAGSTDERTYTFTPGNLPGIKGRMEYTLVEGGSSIGSTAFAFNDSTYINGVTVLKAIGVKTTGMNQLKTLHLETSSAYTPIISGARVERIRGNTIVETLYFDFGNTAMTVDRDYSAIAKKDTITSSTKQILALQLQSGQEQIFTQTSDVAAALLYTTESSASEGAKTIYSTPYVFFTDVGITSLGNTSILEIPFGAAGVDQIVGVSIVSTGPGLKFSNAIAYNYLTNATGEMTLIDTCQVGQEFDISTIEKKLMETQDGNVTPVTLTFTTSSDNDFPGAGTSGRLPLRIHYKTLNGEDSTLEIANLSTALPANTLPSAESSVSLQVQLSNFSHLTAIELNASDDNWHLDKVSAEIRKYGNAATVNTYVTEAFIDQWITSKNPVTAVFNNGDDAENTQNQIVSFSVTGKTSTSGKVATAISGNVLSIQAMTRETVTFTPQITANGTPDSTVIWDTSQYASYMSQNESNELNFLVPASSAGQVFIFTGYCAFDPQKVVTIAIQSVESVPPTTGGNTGGITGGNTDTDSSQDASTEVFVTIDNGIDTIEGPEIPSFSYADGANQTYKLYVTPGEHVGTWNFVADPKSDSYSVSFAPASLSVSNTTGGTVVMTCTDGTNTLFTVNIEVIVEAT